jgi:hypothetical protein
MRPLSTLRSLDTAKGGYECFCCSQLMQPDTHQYIASEGEGIYVFCEHCLPNVIRWAAFSESFRWSVR